MQTFNPAGKTVAEVLDEVQVHDHLALIYEAEAEKDAVIAAYLTRGLKQGERCLFVAPDEEIAHILEVLRTGGIDTSSALRGRSLIISNTEQFPEKAQQTPADVIKYVKGAAADAKAAGFRALRICDDKTWIFRNGFTADLLTEYEALINGLATRFDLTALCVYNLDRFSPEIIRCVIRTHPKVILSGMICNNFSYLPPEEIFRPNHLDLEIRHLLQGMLSKEAQIGTLEMQQALFRTVFENIPEALYVKDLQGRFLLVNRIAARFLGKKVDEVIGRTIAEILPPAYADPIREADRQTVASGMPVTQELTVATEGVEHVLFSVKAPYRNGNGEINGVLGIARDITEEKRLERELADYQEQLRYLASEISLVEERERRKIATALHDQIGQSLALAKIGLEGSRRQLERLNGAETVERELVRIAELLGSAIRRSRTLTEELSPPVLYEIGLEAAVRSLAEEFRKRHGIDIRFQDDGEPKPLSDDLRGLLYQSVRELLVNIVKHARAGSAEVNMLRDGAYMKITVKDDGVGFSGNEKEIRAGSNVGFGLFSIRERLKYLGGCFEVNSSPGSGTEVILAAPIAEAGS